MFWLKWFSFKQKLLALPLIGMLLMGGLALFIAKLSYQQHQMWDHVVVTEMAVIEELDHIMAELSVVHADIHGLLITATNNQDEENIYEMGKPLLNTLLTLKKQILTLNKEITTESLKKQENSDFVFSLKLKKVQDKIRYVIVDSLTNYSNISINAVEMATVDWHLAREHMMRANSHYSIAIRELQSLLSDLRAHIQEEMRINLTHSNQQFNGFILFSLIGLVIMLISGFGLSHKLSSEIQHIVDTINSLARGERNQTVSILADNNGELQRVGESLEHLRIALQKLDNEIAQRRQAEIKLRLSAKVFESTNEGILISDQNNHIVAINPAFTKITGYSEQEALGYNPSILRSGLQDKAFYQTMWQQLLTTGYWQGELRNVRKNGEIWPSWLCINVVDDTENGERYFVGVFTDITQNELLENTVKERTHELMQAKEAAEAASTVKSQFLAAMSHEIRTPMNGIMGMLELLLGDHLEPHAQTLAKTAYTSAENLLHIINDILDFSRIEANKLQLQLKDFNLAALFDNVFNMLRKQAEKKQLPLKFELSEQLPKNIKGDEARIQQILINLLGNAIKFTQTGYVCLKVAVKQQDSRRIVLAFEVIDTGIGISPEQQQIIFHAFEQADNSLTRCYGGIGLGLAISKSLIELQGGQLNLQSQLNEGSCFSFDLSLEVADAEKAQQNQESKQSPSAVCLGKIHVLIVEDNKVNQLVARRMLEKLGVKTSVADNGQLAIDAVKNDHYDLIFMDCHMPVMDGFSSVKLIREQTLVAPNTPIIALTADVQKGIKEKCLQAGMDDYISKPFKQQQLADVLNMWLANNARVD